MRITIAAHVEGGLRVIPEIADFDLCWIEGRNGIGKSVAVRLLQLAAGEHPYSAQQASWNSLRRLLGPTTIKFEDLRGGSELVVELRPQEWPDNPSSPSNLLGSATLDGKDLPLGDVGHHLRVFRIGGDETVISRFRARIDADRRSLERQAGWLDGRLDSLALLVSSVREDLAGVSLDDWKSLKARVDEASAVLEATKTQLSRLSRGVSLLLEAGQIEVSLREIRSSGPEVTRELQDVATQISELRDERERLDSERLRSAPAAQRLEDLLKRQRMLSRVRQKKVAAAQAAESAARHLMESLGVGPSRADVDEASQQALAERGAILRDRSALALLPEVKAVIDELQQTLVPVLRSSLDSEVVAVIGKARVTAEALRTGLDRRQEELVQHEHFAVLEEMERRLTQLDQRIKALRRLKSMLTRSQHADEALQLTDKQWNALSSEIDSLQPDNVAALASAIKVIDEQHIQLIRHQAELQYRQRALDSIGTEDSLVARAHQIAEDLTASDIPQDLPAVEKERDQLQVAFVRDQEALAALTRERNSQLERLEKMATLLESGPRYSWMRTAIGEFLPTPQTDPDAAVAAIDALLTALDQLDAAADGLRNEAAGVRDALSIVADGLTAGVGPAGSSRYVPALTQYYQEDLGELLRDPVIEQGLFPGGSFVGLDLLRSEISWKDAAGLQRKPIEAFSSGEKAFAFVLASILQLAGDDTPNRLMVLDEFGAFIDAEGTSRLKQFLQDRVLATGIADQVVVILPLRVDLPDDEAKARGYLMQRVGAGS